MTRTDLHQGALEALSASYANRTPQLFRDPEGDALAAMWEDIFNSAKQTILEERWAAEVRAGRCGAAVLWGARNA